MRRAALPEDERPVKEPPFERFVGWRAKKLDRLLKAGAEVGDARDISRKSGRATLVAAAAALPSAAFLSLFVSPQLVLVALAPLVPYFAPEVRLRDKVAQRREGVDKELPFFSILVSVLGGAGVSMYSMLDGLAGADIFDAMRKEAMLVRRDVAVFGLNPVESLERIASRHPSRRFAQFLVGYTSKVRSGGDVSAYFATESGALLSDLEGAWARYAARVGVVGSLMVTMFGVVPLLLLTVGFLSPTFSVTGLAAFAFVGVPALTAGLVLMAGRMQPTGERRISGNWRSAGALAAGAAAMSVVSGQVWVAAAAGMFVFSVAYGISVRRALGERTDVDEAVPRFMQDLMEYKRQEYDLARSIEDIAAQGSYNPTFDDFLAKVAVSLRAGVPLDGVRADPGTRISRLAFFVIGQMAYSGGGSVDTMFQLTKYTTKVEEMKRSARAEMKPYVLLSYITPVLLVLGIAFVGGVLSEFGGNVHISMGSMAAGGSAASLAGLTQVADLLIVISAAALGVVSAKITDFTVKNTLRTSTNLALAVAATVAVPAIGLALAHGTL